MFNTIQKKRTDQIVKFLNINKSFYMSLLLLILLVNALPAHSQTYICQINDRRYESTFKAKYIKIDTNILIAQTGQPNKWSEEKKIKIKKIKIGKAYSWSQKERAKKMPPPGKVTYKLREFKNGNFDLFWSAETWPNEFPLNATCKVY